MIGRGAVPMAGRRHLGDRRGMSVITTATTAQPMCQGHRVAEYVQQQSQ
jgi:hypothetical protein